MIEIEGVYISLTALATLWWINAWSGSKSGWVLWIPPYILLGFGMLVKGPFILIFFYCAVLAVLWYAGKLKKLFTFQHAVAIAIFLIMTLGWAYLAFQHTAADKMTGRMTDQLLARLVPRNVNFIHWGSAIIHSFINFVPWLLFVPLLWNKKLISQIAPEHIALFKGCRLGLVLGFAVINLMPGVQPRYSLPAFGLASLLLGWILSLRKDFTASDRVWRTVLLAGLFIAALAALAGLIAIIRTPFAFIVTALTICIAAVIFHRRTLLKSTLSLSMITAVLTVVIVLQYAVFGMSLITSRERRRPAAAVVNNALPPGQTVYVFKPGYRAFLFYVRPPLKYVLGDDQVGDDVHYLLLEQQDWERLKNLPRISSRDPIILCQLPDNVEGQYNLVKLK
jgi:4-amino-4-deoxy-L-arabinose transferase-like glycosyltransferase